MEASNREERGTSGLEPVPEWARQALSAASSKNVARVYEDAKRLTEALRERLVLERRESLLRAAVVERLNELPADSAWLEARRWVKRNYGHEFDVEGTTLATGAELRYVNRGDTYDETVCHTDVRGFFLSSWGDEVEAGERARTEDTGDERCPYCGEWFDPGAVGPDGRTPCCGKWCTECRGHPCQCGEHLRAVDLDGYRPDLWDTGAWDRLGKSKLRYRLQSPDGETIFAGRDFAASPLHAIDSDETVRALLGFLTLQPGDTDAEYFEGYTDRQRQFAEQEAEALSLYALEDGPELQEFNA